MSKAVKVAIEANDPEAVRQSLLPGKQAYVVVRPKGMNWCNVFQIAPPRLRYEDSSKAEALARELAKVSGASALSIEYSDTSDAASVFRAEPAGIATRWQKWSGRWVMKLLHGRRNNWPSQTKTNRAAPSGWKCWPGRRSLSSPLSFWIMSRAENWIWILQAMVRNHSMALRS